MKTVSTPFRPSEKDKLIRFARIEGALEGAERPNLVWDPLCGHGIFASFIAGKWPGVRIVSSDHDAGCVIAYAERQIPNATVSQLNVLDAPEPAGTDAAIMSVNLCTMLDFVRAYRGEFQKLVLARLLKNKKKWMTIEDTACSKLHLNWYSYGLKSWDINEYFELLSNWFEDTWGYRVAQISSDAGGAICYRIEPCR